MDKSEFAEGRFDKEGRPREWHTAFYYLAEHVKFLTGGAINHKGLYALVGVDGSVNDANPRIRKSVAGKLSTIVHSKEYAADMQDRFLSNRSSFDEAAHVVCSAARAAQGWGGVKLWHYLIASCWPDVWRGLNNEKDEWRASLDLKRIGREAQLAFDSPEGDQRDAPAVLSVILHLISFGCVEVPLARSFVLPTAIGPGSGAADPKEWAPCLVRYADETCSVITDFWQLPKDRPFTIGRFTDCDSIESDARISRVHGRISFEGGRWVYEDLQSVNGSVVLRDGEEIPCSGEKSPGPVALELGDRIVVAGTRCYWFGPYGERSWSGGGSL